MLELSTDLRDVMRLWATGVTIVTSLHLGSIHGMTVNSFTSVSLDPPIVTVTLAKNTRTHQLVLLSGVVGITLLSQEQPQLSQRFSGRLGEETGRFTGVPTFSLVTGAPLILGGLGFIDGRVRVSHALPNSTIFIINVLAAQSSAPSQPLIYLNRAYRRLANDN